MTDTENKKYKSKPSDEQSTPQEFFDGVNARYRFSLDVCATKENAKCSEYYTEAEDGLKQPWCGVVWCNPPYSDPSPWLKKAVELTARSYVTTVVLVRVDTSTKWWHKYATQAMIWELVDRRLRFNGAKGSPNFASALLVFMPVWYLAFPPSTFHINQFIVRGINNTGGIEWQKHC